MEINLSKYAGFCPGTRHADETIKELLRIKNPGDHIYTLGKIIHNRLYIEDLEKMGVFSAHLNDVQEILSLQPIGQIYMIVRTHGIRRGDFNYLKSLSDENPRLKIVDVTCPSVKKIHNIAEKFTNENTHFVLYGDSSHPEVAGITSYVNGKFTVVSSLDDVKEIQFGDKIPILCAQTTQNLLEFIKIKNFLKKVYTNAIFFDTICSVTEKRQQEALTIAEKSDAMIVLGGYDSSNTRKLYELCKKVCQKTIWAESTQDLITVFSDDIKSVGITAGASTPDGIILEVLKKYGKL